MVLAALPSSEVRAESGYDLWLRYVAIDDVALRDAYRRSVTALVVPGESPTARLTLSELNRGVAGLLGADATVSASVDCNGAVLVGTPTSAPAIASLGWTSDLARVGSEGYIIRSAEVNRHAVTVIASMSDTGALRGAFHFLRLIQTRRPIAAVNIIELAADPSPSAEPLGQPRWQHRAGLRGPVALELGRTARH